MAQQVKRGLLAHKVPKGPQVLRGSRGLKAIRAHRDLKASKGIKAIEDQWGHKGQLVQQEKQARKVLWGRQVKPGIEDQLDRLVKTAYPLLRLLREMAILGRKQNG